jgi:hypothetical protein
MNTKSVLLVSLTSGLACGFVGGLLACWVMSPDGKSATFETVRITKDLFVAPASAPEKGCRLDAGGTIVASGGLVANQIRGNLIVGQSVMATFNATQQSLDQQQIAAVMTANPELGGGLMLRSPEGIFCPAKGPSKQGFETFIGFDKASHAPAMFTQNNALGQEGRAYMICAAPKAKGPQSQAPNQPQSQPQDQPQFQADAANQGNQSPSHQQQSLR